MKTALHTTSSMSKVLVVLLISALLPIHARATIRGMEKTTKANVAIGSAGSSGADWASESQFTGNVTLSIPLASIGGISLNLQYNSRVSSLVRSANSTSGSGWVGLGWTLSVGSIVGNIGSTLDSSDDHYQLVDASGTSDLVKGSSGSFLIRQHKPWQIRRVIASGTIVGWEIKTEDGTILRYGNYNKDVSDWVFPAFGPTYATRCAIGVNGVVENSRQQDFASDALIPTQWDLSDIQDPAGNHTTIIYQQTQAPLSNNGYNSSVSYTIESHPYKIQDNRGGEVELVLGTMDSDEYYAEAYTYFQSVYEKQFLDTLKIKRNGQVFQRINMKYRTSQDILCVGAKKRYLSQIDIYDKNANRMPFGMFAYWGLIDSTQGMTDTTKGLNPGGLRRITYQSGGKLEFSYKSQRASSVATNCTVNVSDSIKAAETTLPNASGVSGRDFFVVSNALYAQGGSCTNWWLGIENNPIQPIRVFRFGPLGWYRDLTFPYDSCGNLFAVNDYVVGIFRGVWKAIRRTGETWAIFDIDTALTAAGANVYGTLANTKGVAGFTPDYFVMKYNRTKSVQGQFNRYLCSLAVIRFEDDGLHAELLDGRFREFRDPYPDNSGFKAFDITAEGSSTYLIINSVDSTNSGYEAPVLETHYKRSNGQWKKLIDRALVVWDPWKNAPTSGAIFPTSAPRYAIGKNFVACVYPEWNGLMPSTLRMYQITGDGIALVDTSLEQDGTYPVVGDNFYGVMSKVSNFLPWFKEWNGTSFGTGKTYLNSIFASMTASSAQPLLCEWQRFNNRLICTWQDTCVYTGVSIRSSSGVWSTGLVKDARFHPTNGPPYGSPVMRILPVSSNSYVTLYDGTTAYPPPADPPGHMFWKTDSYSFIGDSIVLRPMAKTWTEDSNGNANWAPPNYLSSSHVFQPGNNFFTSTWVNPPGYGLLDTVSAISRVQDSLAYDSYGTVPYDIVLDKKYAMSGMGDTIVTTYTFENGSFEEGMSSGKYNKTTVNLPGSSGKKTTFYYNDLDATNAKEFVSATNYLELDGRAYREKDSSLAGILVRERVVKWAADGIDLPDRGVFFVKQLQDSVITDGIPKVTSYEYSNPSHLQVTKITETNSDGIQRVTRMKYPLDYSTTSPTSSDPMVRALDSMKTVNHVVNAVIEKWIYKKAGNDTSIVLAADLTKYSGFSSGRILPFQTLRLRDTAVSNFVQSSSSASTFSDDNRYVTSSTIDQYTAFGEISEAKDANGVAGTTLWGYTSSLPVAQIANARTSSFRIGSECSYIGFESGRMIAVTSTDSSDVDYWSLYGENSYNVSSTDAHTGLYSQQLPGYNLSPATAVPRYGPTRDFCPPDLAGQNRMYVISCWVKTQSGFASGAARLVAMTKANTDANNDLYPDIIQAFQSTSTGDTYGSWVYLEVRIDVKAIRQIGGISPSELLRIRVFPENHDATHYMLVDDIRVYPVDGMVSASTTYDPILLLPTYESDASGLFTAKSYDGFGRLLQVKNSQGSLLKEYSYYFSRDGNGGVFQATDPNYTREKTYRATGDTTTVKKYTDGLGREIQTEVFKGDSDIISHTKYDSLGRPSYAYKPYQVSLGSNKHKYDSNFSSDVSSYYSSLGISLGSTPYSETRYVSDPLNRVQYQGAPSDVFKVGGGHEVKIDYVADQTNKWNVT